MKATEFRLGNLVYYHIEDSMDERKEWDEISPIDYDDLRCFVQYEDNSEYKPIPLTEEWLLKFGFTVGRLKNCYFKDWGTNGVESVVLDYHYKGGFEYELGSNRYKVIEYVHQLQNLYFALTGEELTLK